MQNFELQAATRTKLGKQVASLRTDSLVPGVVYGHDLENRNVTVPAMVFEKLYAKAGASTLVNLTIDESTAVPVLIHDVQRDPITSDIQHVDFYQVSMKEKLTTEIAIVLVGESPAVKAYAAILVKTLDHVVVECLPSDLVHELAVDISVLKEFDDAIRVSDIVLPTGLTLKTDPEEMVVAARAPRTEEEMKADLATAPSETAVADVEVEAKGKKPEEGEAPAEAAKKE